MKMNSLCGIWLIGCALTGVAQTYDVSRDFSLASNPNGVWSYGWKGALDGSFNLLPAAVQNRADNGVLLDVWSLTANTAPAVYHNGTTNTATSDGGQGVYPPGTTWFYAGENGAPQNFGVVRLTVPTGGAGTHRLESSVRPYLDGPPGNDNDYYVFHNTSQLHSQNVPLFGSGGYSNTIVLNGGDIIDLIVGRGTDGLNSGLKIRATLTRTSSTLVVPRVNETVDGSATDGGGSGLLNHALHSQTVYGASQFPSGSLRITEIRLRPSAVWGSAFTSTIPNLQINMSTTAAQANNLSATFADNVGANDTVVFQGPITLSSRFVGPAGGPKEFDIIIPLQTPFTYDPSAGNLLVEVRNPAATSVTHVDAGGAFNDDCSRAYAFSATATTANTRDKAAEVLQLVYQAAPPAQAPQIVTQPTNQTANAGATVTFNVSATGTAPLAYQWRKNGTDISGATQQSLVISNVQASHAGTYSVRVSNSAGSVISSDATLTVISPPPPPPPPAGDYAVIPESAEGTEQVFGSGTFDTAHRSQQVYGSVEFPQHPMLIHEFRFRPDSVYGGAFTATVANIQINLSTTHRVPDALSPTFADNVGSDDTVVYQGPLTISSRFTGGSPKDFDIIVRLQRPYLYDPANGNLMIDTRNFSGSSALRLGGQGGPDIASRVLGGISAASGTPDTGADAIQVWFTRPSDSTTLVVPRINENLDGSATDGGGSGLLNHALHSQTVYGASQFPSGSLRITEIRLRPSAVWGSAFTSTIPNLQINMSTTAAQANNLSATFADNVGANDTVVFQGPITLSSRFVGPTGGPTGGPKEFDIIIPLQTPFTYDPSAGNLLVEVRNPTATSVTHVDAGGAFDDDCSRAYAFSATATTANTRDKGAEVLQLIYQAAPPPPAQAPQIVTQPTNQTANVGATVVFNVSATGTAPLAYQWRKNGTNISGATQQSLVISNVQASHAGTYSVRVSNTAGSATSSNATLTLVSPPPPPPPAGDYAVIPESAEGVEQVFGSGTFDTAHRSQQVYGSVEFPQHPMLIHEFRFRPDSVYGGAFTATVANIQINLSTTRRVPDALSPTFADNVGSDDTIVHQGPLTISSRFTGGSPKDFDIIVRLQRPYLYDPANGNLMIDTRNFSGSSALRLGGQNAADVASRVLGGISAASGTPDSGADAIQVWFTRPADSTTLVVPRINENLDGSATDGGGSGLLNHALHSQTVYGASQFPSGSLRITEIRLRPSAVWGSAFTSTIPNLQINMSTTAAQANNLSATFADNVGPNDAVVFQGPITLSSRFVGPTGGPKEFDIIIPLQTPFTYDPSAGNLLVEVRNPMATSVTHVDAGGAFDDDSSRAYAFSATATTADTRDKGAEVLQLVFDHSGPPPNNPPMAKAVVSPVVDLSPKLTNLLVLSVNGTAATVTLDGSQSSDPEGAALSYEWFVNGSATPVATGANANVSLALGSHEITLVVDDGQHTDSDTVEVEVITIDDMLSILVVLVDETGLPRKNTRPLITTLKQAQHAAEGDRAHVAINKLEQFQQKVAAQITPINAECAEALINAAQKVIDALSAP